jgi:hypothetical protein
MYYGGMASCEHGWELLPGGATRRNPRAKIHYAGTLAMIRKHWRKR